MKIFLIRHAESEQNIFKADKADSFVDITENGVKQANECAQFLLKYAKENNIDLEKSVMFVSPHLRTKRTAEIFNQKLNVKDFRFDNLLIERQFGLFDNMTNKERNKYLKKNKLYNKYYTQTGKFYSTYPFGESVFDVVLRLKMFINFSLKNLDSNIENVFIISHGYAISAFEMAYFNYLPEWIIGKQKMENCSVKLIEGNVNIGYIYGGEIIK